MQHPLLWQAAFALKQEYKMWTAMENTEYFTQESNKIPHSHNKRQAGDGRGKINTASLRSPAT
jgi:hypothetical protein